MSVLAAAAAFACCLLLVSGPPAARLREREDDVERGDWQAGRRRPILAIGLTVTVGVAGALVSGAAGAVVAFAATAPAVTALLVWRRHAGRTAAKASAEAVAGACQLLAGLLRLGHVPADALRAAARDSPILAEVAAVQQVGGTVGPVLRRLGGRPGCSGLAELGIAWEVAERTGASLSATLDALAERLAAARTVQDVVAAELSAPRATGRLLAVLPAAGLLLGYSLGGDPVGFLTGSLPGQLSLVAGVALGCAGVFWTEAIADGGDG